jgi:hypothetical protein
MSGFKKKKFRMLIFKILIYPASFYLLLSIAGCLMADRLIFHPRPASYKDNENIIKIPVNATENIAAIYQKNDNAIITE